MTILTEPSTDYHARTGHVSKGMLDLIAKSPAHLRASLDGAKRAPTPSMVFGAGAHAAVLEPDKLIAKPDFNLRTKAGRAKAADFSAAVEAAGTDLVFVDEASTARYMSIRDSIMRHPVARRLLDDGLPERTVLADIDGIPVRCRPDWYRPSAGLIVDLKTTADASPDSFAKSMWNYRYHVQHAWYTDVCLAAGLDVRAFVFIAVESSPPYCTAVYVLDSSDVELGRRTYQHDLETYRRCLETGDWPGYSDHIEVIRLPAWATRKTTINQEVF